MLADEELFEKYAADVALCPNRADIPRLRAYERRLLKLGLWCAVGKFLKEKGDNAVLVPDHMASDRQVDLILSDCGVVQTSKKVTKLDSSDDMYCKKLPVVSALDSEEN